MLKDQIDLLSEFNAAGVEYLVIGGHAVNAYGVPRMTKDLDVLIRPSVIADNLPVPFISREDLIANKLKSARPQDLADVDHLRRAANTQRSE